MFRVCTDTRIGTKKCTDYLTRKILNIKKKRMINVGKKKNMKKK